ncbi:hypothetical protein UCDDA912_g00125 [Diaporthe ampelina]|uniref:AsqO/PenF-like C-terminal domain-containing protein n=1 Tax=Diaporthe ampelina TaxID=1214573 RepID=A0A0G2IGM8_9PEZI|nr:hypothetical protein UCDDA912_g00125 [Diaporthe ampelina]
MKGDVVAVLVGCSVPVILRNTAGTEEYEIVGEAFMPGFMNGEAIGGNKALSYKPLKEEVGTWYRGHAQVGDYSLVWFDALAKDGTEHSLSWVTEHLLVVYQSCQSQSILARPWGDNRASPPKPRLPAPPGYEIHHDLGDGRVFVANFTTEADQMSTYTYKRVVGSVVGGFEGEEQHTGPPLRGAFQY